MTRNEAVKYIRYCMCEGRLIGNTKSIFDEKWQAGVMAIDALEQKIDHWIPVKFRPLTDEEQEEYPDYCYMADCLMPDDGEEILVSTKYGRVEKDECRFDNGYYLDSGYDWQTDIVAWMPLPKPYKPQEREP